VNFLDEAKNLNQYMRTFRRDFHQHPELGFQEFRTARAVSNELESLGLETRIGIGKTGVVALLEGIAPGPVILLRFDMDALPIQEETGVEYASANTGVMHACGHDGHIAVGLAVARLLHSHRTELKGTIKFMFQPAEEGLGGADAMLHDGVLEDPKPNYALALHLWNEKPLGWFGISDGSFMAGAEIFKLKVMGKGGHGAQPHLTVDPVLTSAQIINALQSIVARNVSPIHSAVISVTSIHGGVTFNVIPSIVEMQGTIRTNGQGVRGIVLDRIKQIIDGVASAMGCQAELEIKHLTPAVVNDPRVSGMVRETASILFPEFQIDSTFSTMVSEDMAFIMQKIPGCFFFIGSANSDKGLNAPHHHPRFDFDEETMVCAAALMSASAVKLLNIG
jgi:amidohydrolase